MEREGDRIGCGGEIGGGGNCGEETGEVGGGVKGGRVGEESDVSVRVVVYDE